MEGSGNRWPERTSADPLEPGAVHVWAASLDVPPARLAELRATLCADERERAARFRGDLLAHRFIAARGMLRELLGGYLGADPASIRFTYGAYGKPALFADAALHFNVSHSRGLALFAFTSAAPVGVDVEHVAPMPDMAGMVSSFFAPAERDQLAALPEAEYEVAFYRCWARKEAYLKAGGAGLSVPLDSFDVSVSPGGGARLLRVAGAPDAPLRWSLLHLQPTDDSVGALAIEAPAPTIRCWTMAR